MSEQEPPHVSNCLDVIRPFVEQLESSDVQIMGGVGTEALRSQDIEIHSDRKEVIVPKGFFLPTYREDNTRRDVDVLVLSSDEDRLAAVEQTLETTVGEALQREVFGFRPITALKDRIYNPLGARAIFGGGSDRYEISDDPSMGQVKMIYPFAVPIEPETLETWSLIVGDEAPMPIPHPATTIANYTNRSITGLRPKDELKAAQMAETVFSKAPEFREWLIEGPGASQFELSYILASLLHPKIKDFHIVDGIKVDTMSIDELRHHEAFLANDLMLAEQLAILGLARVKTKAVSWFEKHPSFVTWWRNHLEQRLSVIVKNT